MSAIPNRVGTKILNVILEELNQKAWFRSLSSQVFGKGFNGISIGDTNEKFFRSGWKSVDLLNADVVCDVRESQLPFMDNTMDAVHASHLVEHIADPKQLFGEVHRCLKPGGVFRLSTPDLDLLISKYRANEWKWFLCADGRFILERVIGGKIPADSLLIHNRFIGWLGSYSGRLDTAGGPVVDKAVVDEKLQSLTKYEFRDWVVSLLEPNRVYAHVHVYDFDEIATELKVYGFTKVMLKQYGESNCAQMTSPIIDHEFHKTYSMYVEAIK